jgi:protein-tyrosine phosphatase
VSGAPSRHDWPWLVRAGIKGVLEVRSEARDDEELLESLGLRYRRVALREGSAPEIEVLQEASTWVLEVIQGAGPVLIHCGEGRGRSVLFACSALLRLGLPLDAVMRMARRGQPGTAFSEDQSEMLLTYAEACRAQRGEC